MIEKVNNNVTINGRLYGLGRFGLTEKDGKIRGAIRVLTNSETQNVVDVEFMPQAPTWGNGKENPNYTLLKNIMTNPMSVEKVGEDAAMRLRITADLSLNSYYVKEGSDFALREGVRYRGKFAHDNSNGQAPDCATFDIDGLFLGIDDELDRDGNTTGAKIIRLGVIDSYRNVIMPSRFKLTDPNGIALMETYVPNETYVRVLGDIINEAVVTETETEMDFGAPAVHSVTRYSRANLITAASTKSDVIITDEDLKTYSDNRNKILAEAKQRAMSKGDSEPAGFESTPIVKTAASTRPKFDF